MKTIEWKNGKVVLIDQTKLPLIEEYIVTDDYRRVAEAIKILSVRGAPAIGVAAAYAVALAAMESQAKNTEDFLEELGKAIKLIGATRPTAVNLFWALERMKDKASANSHLAVSRLKRVLKEEADLIAAEELEMSKKMGDYGAELIADGDNVLTHCNAGALATVDYGTALAVIRSAHNQGKNIHVYADETRPLLQGARLTTWELMRENIPVTLICDNMAGHFMSLGKVDKIVVGADRVAANGDIANKIGTYSVAVLAKEHNIPFYVAVPVTTIDISIPDGSHIPIEERESHEVTGFGGLPVAAEGVTVANPAFDVTPNRYITAIITDKGVLKPPYDKAIARLFKK
ncbi:MAG: S-methyl-5-thioribose-1-phosphate isomerase [Actinomycetota bacterium]|nr:S-methyl-5-thioribose-1-phosphate isomerase [Actinomycetota bacterium]